MSLPLRKTKPRKDTRWRSTAHRNWIRSFHCAMCGRGSPVECAHVRILGNGGMGFKPDDWDTVPLCRDCHHKQHTVGERSFWRVYAENHGQTLDALLAALCNASPKAAEIRRVRADGA